MKNKIVVSLLFLFGFIVIPSLVGAQFVTIPDQCSSYGTWDQTTKTCTLNQDLNQGQDQGVEISAGDTILNCDGHNITGSINGAIGGIGNMGIYISGGNNIVVENCNISGFVYGVYIYCSIDYNTLKNNNFSGNTYGIWLGSSSNNDIENNSITSSWYSGILFNVNSNSNTIKNNTFSNSIYGYGVSVYTSNNNIFSGNDISGNYYGGITAGASNGNIFINNNISKNNQHNTNGYAISLINSSSNNKIYHNNFIDNVIIPGTLAYNNKPNVSADSLFNSFDNGYPSGGNYWSDYGGVDVNSGVSQDKSNSDGVGDTPYIFIGGKDNYPIMVQSGWETFPQLSKTPVLIVPGLMGTDINEGSNKLWLDLAHNFADVGDSFMNPLQFNQNLIPTDASLTIGSVISKETVNVGVGNLSIFDYTDGLINEFKNQGYVGGVNFFTFPYDWRYGVTGKFADGTTNSDLLAQKIQDIMAQTGASKVDVVAHSLGGLITKQYVMNHPMDNHIGKAVFVGVPNTGAPKAVKALLQGDNMGVLGLSDQEMKKIAANMPSVYDLLPSQQYYNTKGSYIETIDQTKCSGDYTIPCEVKDLNYAESNSFLSGMGLNSLAINNATNLHTQNFDNFDLRTAGVDLYAIDGCKSATLSKVVQTKYNDIFGQQVSYDVHYAVGDNTVPFESATNLPIDASKKYYSLNADHGKMPSQNGIRQEIVNLISGSNLDTGSAYGQSLMTQDISKCQLTGKAISVFSPVNVFVTDQNGNKLGLAADGSIINEIPNADFEVIGEHKFLYLPQDAGQVYSINMQGIGTGTYTIKSESINNSQPTKEEIFSNLPVTTALTGNINIGSGSTTLSVQQSPTDSPTTILPTKVLDFSADKISPETTIYFDPMAKDLKFLATDNLSDASSISIVDNSNVVVLTDETGNTTELDFKERNRRTAMLAEIVSIKYNGVPVNIGSNSLGYSWSFDKSGKLAKLTQKVKLRNNYSITAVYDGVNTKITGTTSAGKISQSFVGLKVIKVTTNKGDLSWSY
ncbi:MAG: right-handed parallel beta-helix repeat-containing protein [Candidatus Staskawiczbacteria bacterium]|nr:right-handed parallel beta-helix repeat-containing protein [Candidatus Staskawiczbacteria bacterium]